MPVAPIESQGDSLLVVCVNRTYPQRSAYDAARFAWSLSETRATGVDYVLASYNRVIVGVFEPNRWAAATQENFPEFRENLPHRRAFMGTPAPLAVRTRYEGCNLPDNFSFSRHGIRYARPSGKGA